LVAPEAGEVESCTQLPEFGALSARYCERVAIAVLCRRVIMH
jgi:hypothetical protein